jgi:L-rhamnose isomerase
VLLTVTSSLFKFEPDKVKDCALVVVLIQTFPKLPLIVPADKVGLAASALVTVIEYVFVVY